MAKEETFSKNEYPRANYDRQYNIFVDKDLNTVKLLNISGFWICHGL